MQNNLKTFKNFLAIGACIYYTLIKKFIDTIPTSAEPKMVEYNPKPAFRTSPFVAVDGFDVSTASTLFEI